MNCLWTRRLPLTRAPQIIVFYVSQIFVVSTVSCLVGESKTLSHIFRKHYCPAALDPAGSVESFAWQNPHARVPERWAPQFPPSIAPFPPPSLPNLFSSAHDSLTGTRARDVNCGKVSCSLPRTLLSQCHLIYVNMDGMPQSLAKEKANDIYFDYQLGLTWSCFLRFFSIRGSQNPLKTPVD